MLNSPSTRLSPRGHGPLRLIESLRADARSRTALQGGEKSIRAVTVSRSTRRKTRTQVLLGRSGQSIRHGLRPCGRHMTLARRANTPQVGSLRGGRAGSHGRRCQRQRGGLSSPPQPSRRPRRRLRLSRTNSPIWVFRRRSIWAIGLALSDISTQVEGSRAQRASRSIRLRRVRAIVSRWHEMSGEEVNS